MLLKYYTEEGYLNLYDSVDSNIESYRNLDNTFLDKYQTFVKESKIDANLPIIKEENGDYANIILVYGSLKDIITPRQACNPYLWSYMTHCEYWDYTLKRWGKENISKGTVKERFFCGSEKGSRRGFLRNALSRLWWTGYLTYLEEEKDPYRLTRLLTSNSDLWLNIVERGYSMNRNITIGILEGIDKYQKEYNEIKKDEWIALCKYINRRGGATILDILDSIDICNMCFSFLKSFNDQ